MLSTLMAARDVSCGILGMSLIEASLFTEVISYHFPYEVSEALGDDGSGAPHTPRHPA